MKRFNGGRGALACDNCGTLIAVGVTRYEWVVDAPVVTSGPDGEQHYCGQACADGMPKRKTQETE